MTDDQELEVYFDKYCKTCKHELLKENESPCDFCLEEPVNLGSHKPVKWEEAEKPKQNKPIEPGEE